jgi:hypothetical protein
MKTLTDKQRLEKFLKDPQVKRLISSSLSGNETTSVNPFIIWLKHVSPRKFSDYDFKRKCWHGNITE